mmetsp:Transcript_10880/g.32456  ORF Transcript_10880/g.32456 Transcript_10880/m.32456 type:complete len:271 (-) Transcript_10880:1142-1954(-)
MASRPQTCVSTPTVRCTEGSAVAQSSVSVVWGQPAGTYKTSPGSRVASSAGVASSSSSPSESAPLPRASGSAPGTGVGGRQTRQRLAPWHCSTSTRCLSVCGGAEMRAPAPVAYAFVHTGRPKASMAARLRAATLEHVASSELSTHVWDASSTPTRSSAVTASPAVPTRAICHAPPAPRTPRPASSTSPASAAARRCSSPNQPSKAVPRTKTTSSSSHGFSSAGFRASRASRAVAAARRSSLPSRAPMENSCARRCDQSAPTARRTTRLR